MFRGPAVQPLAEAPRVMPKGTRPISGGEPEMTLQEAGAILKNPLEPSAEHIAHGKAMFDTQCAQCHGVSGRGDGPVVHLLRTKPPSLQGGLANDMSDGYIYAIIRDGKQYMPALGDAMSAHERWEVVLYVRALQGKLPREAPTQAGDQ